KPTCTYVDGVGDFTKDNYSGKNIFYGVREHAMAAISNGLALCGIRPYAATFLAFSNFMLPSIRLACMMHLPITYIFTHDSISVGEDGPTHQPIEQISQLRDIPNLEVFRPADVNEIIGAYKEIYNKKENPSAILLSRNTLPILNCTKTNEVVKGGYIARDFQTDKKAILISSGEELTKCIDIATKLQSKGIGIRVVSVPNIDRFLSQDKEYIDEVLPVEIKKIVIEASNSKDWYKIIYNLNNVININDFGVSAPKEDVYKHFEFDIDSLQTKIEEIIK
ncbi:MAG: transketolase, partial [Bacilli bacterium]|nr:transketolase [Bacilli bacterium]